MDRGSKIATGFILIAFGSLLVIAIENDPTSYISIGLIIVAVSSLLMALYKSFDDKSKKKDKKGGGEK